ncbi:hypothetical protein BDV27DRAFT_128716 [Aspergillus caelatus]|uniref:DUF7730 domain-containing protein n=1 Tax=Aspergillus caelatus TaxID=61420 RepID=A0A5N7A510_9EURO|nr:uncharacterized protein BDV27DRAFT_128716 [Aspergillus caelatus]KAE8364286.1 hypothetical protein BDV27DRAFT_128716 [Aspergillus caelatus]
MPLKTPFLFLQLPSELRFEVYRHLFGIAPHTRLRVGEACLDSDLPHNTETSMRLSKTFEVYVHTPSAPKATNYAQIDSKHYSRKEQSRHHIYRQHRHLFLAILATCKTIYEEAMPFFYSSTFFAISGNIAKASNWLLGMSPQRRRYIRRLSFHFSSKALSECFSNQSNMQFLAEELMYMDQVDVVELLITNTRLEEELLDFAEAESLGIPQYAVSRRPCEPLVLFGVEQLEAVPRLGCLRIVGRIDRLLQYTEDKEYLKAIAEGRKPVGLGKGNGHRPVVELVQL